MSNLHYFVALNSLKYVSPKLVHKLIKVFSTPEAIFNSSFDQLKQVPGIRANAVNSILNFRDHDSVADEIQKAKLRGISLVPFGSPLYPEALSNIYDPPILLYVKGSLKPVDSKAVAIVGARKASSYGLKAANSIASFLAENKITLISGLARGIDTEIHRTTLRKGGRTIAVLGSGLDFIYPPENKNLYNDIAQTGAVISEFPLLTPPEKYNFPRRNRIISGLSLGTVVVEAGLKSGSLITARFALDQGRDVFAIPGPLNSRTSEGTHALIQEGAKLVHKAADILLELNLPIISKSNNIKELSDIENWLLDKLDEESYSVNKLVDNSIYSIQNIKAAVTKLELKGFIRQIHGDRFAKEY
jgi:DNA processing protein